MKRYHLQTVAFNLGLVMRSIVGAGTPKGLYEKASGSIGLLFDWLADQVRFLKCFWPRQRIFGQSSRQHVPVNSRDCIWHQASWNEAFSTACYGAGEIVAHVLTDGNVDDARTGVERIEQVDGGIKSFIGDATYDTAAIYHAAGAKGGTVIVPTVKVAVVAHSKLPFSAGGKTVLKVKDMGRRKWEKDSSNHRQGRVENTFFKYTRICGGKLHARHAKAQEVEAALVCRILNRMSEFQATRIGRESRLKHVGSGPCKHALHL